MNEPGPLSSNVEPQVKLGVLENPEDVPNDPIIVPDGAPENNPGTKMSGARASKRYVGYYCLEIFLTIASFYVTDYFYKEVVFPTGASGAQLLRAGLQLGIICAAWSAALWLSGTYNDFHDRDVFDEIWMLAKAVLPAAVVLFAVVTLTESQYVSRSFLFIFIGVNFVMLFSVRALAKDFMRHHERMGYNRRYVLVVGLGSRARDLAHALKYHRDVSYHIAGFLDDNERVALPVLDGAPVLGTVSQLAAILKDNVIDDVYFVMPNKTLGELEDLIKMCDEVGVRFHITIPLLTELNSDISVSRLMGESLLSFSSVSAHKLRLRLKRFIDIAGSTILLLALSPLFALVACVIRLTSQGRAIFSQSRLGMNGRIFTMYKFRTMHIKAEEQRQELERHNELRGPFFKIKNDPRVTPLGRLLRRLSLDELPQLWNVLRGDMSLVGPRPSLISEVKLFESWQRRRMAMRPGMTCIWQVNGRNNITNTEQGLAMDLEYIDNWSLRLDFKIILKTVGVILSGKGAY